MKEWNTPVIEEIDIKETASGACPAATEMDWSGYNASLCVDEKS